MAEPSEATDGLITFNVVYTPGSVASLLPFAPTLLHSPRVAVRLVANNCGPDELELISEVSASQPRISLYVLPFDWTLEHGEALNHLLEAFTEPHFAFLDSDAFASGDFMETLWPIGPGEAGVFAGTSVWMTDEETDTAPGPRIAGRQRLADGTFIGTSYCAIYDSAILEPVWRATPKGFAGQHSHHLDAELKAGLAERGWHFRTFDTARLVNLRLLMEGHDLGLRDVPELHHIGGFSVREYSGSRGVVLRLRALFSRGSTHRLRRLADGALWRIYVSRQGGGRRQRQDRRDMVLSYVDQVLAAIREDRPLPPAPKTGAPEVDRRLAELVSLIETEYAGTPQPTG